MGRKSPYSIVSGIYDYLEKHPSATPGEIVKGCRINPRTARNYLELLTEIKDKPFIYKHEKNRKSKLFTTVYPAEGPSVDTILKEARSKLNENELKELSALVDNFVLRKYYIRWARFEGVCMMIDDRDRIYQIIEEGLKVDGVRMIDSEVLSRFPMGHIPSALVNDLKKESVRLIILAEELAIPEQIISAIAISRLCIANRVPFILVPSFDELHWHHNRSRMFSSFEDITCAAVTNPGKAELSLRQIVDALEKRRIPLFGDVESQRIESVLVRNAPPELKSLARRLPDLIRLARLTGKVAAGFESIESIKSGKARLVLISNDSRNSNILPALCVEHGIPFVFAFDKWILGLASGTPNASSVSIVNAGVAAELIAEVVRDVRKIRSTLSSK